MAITEPPVVPAKKEGNALRLSAAATGSLIKYAAAVLEAKRRFIQFTDKLTAVDVAYACYKAIPIKDAQPMDGVDLLKKLPIKDVQIPIIASQVDSVVAHLADVYLSGYPMFPVVASSKNKELSEKFEAIVDNHAVKGRYSREMQLIFRDAAKYNLCAIEARWGSMSEFSPLFAGTFDDGELAKPQKLTTTKRINPYNLIWDYRVEPSRVADDGEYTGYVELMGRIALKRLLNKYSAEGIGLNIKEAIQNETGISAVSGKPITYVEPPQISPYINSTAYQTGGTWLEWLEGQKGDMGVYPGYSNMYEVATIYARIIPKEHGIISPKPNTPQIWRLQVVNEQVLIYAQPEQTPHDRLPILLGQAIEDGLSYQTRSIGEAQIPFQQAGSDLYNVRISGAKRAINDRGIYDSNLIDEGDINSTVPAAKIPVRNLKMGKTLRDAYIPIPFQDGSTVGAMQDLQQTMQLSNMLFGVNPFKQGQTVKGNRTLGEFQSIDNNSSSRSRLVAMMMEVHIFLPLKDVIKLNILANKDSITALSFNTGDLHTVKPSDFVDAILEFKIADGETPKSKLADSNQLQVAFQTLQQIPAISAGYNMPDMFAHLMSLIGVRNLQQYQYDPASKEAIIAAAMPFLGDMIKQVQAQQAQQGGAPNDQPSG